MEFDVDDEQDTGVGCDATHWHGYNTIPDSYPFRELVREVLSPGALGALEQLSPVICAIYGLPELLTVPLPEDERAEHVDALVTRVQRVVRLLPYGISPIPNEVFTAIEFLVYQIHHEPIEIGTAIIRLESLADEIRSRPLLHDLMMNRAN